MGKDLQLIDVLRKAFPGILDKEADEMIGSGQVLPFPGNTVICLEGALQTTFYIILEGEVEIRKTINDTEVRVLTRLGPGDFFGEMAIIHGAPRAATVVTTCPTTVLEIPREGFSSMIKRSSSMSMAIVQQISKRLRENDEMAIEDLCEKAGQLAEAYQQLAEQDYTRRVFLTTIAHELRTPLMAANGFLQILRSGALQGQAFTAALETVSRNLTEITTLTNDILFLQEMELILPAFEQTDVGGLVASAVEQQREKAERNGVGMTMTIAPGLPRIPADSKSLERAIVAMIDNGIKFSPEGGAVNVDVGFNEVEVWVRIQDHGVGIPAKYLPRIFERFFHLDEVAGHLFRGAGLGLSIARQVIEQHKGRVTVESELGRGSTFTIHLRRNQ
ncbi:MAG TPA: ATP-binding protein [Anaerolineaceae bacterium]|nr:ATP-binding protein [Anaerolineaceae bacterium]